MQRKSTKGLLVVSSYNNHIKQGARKTRAGRRKLRGASYVERYA